MEQKPVTNTSDSIGWLFGVLLIVLGGLARLGNFLGNVSGFVWALIFMGAGAGCFVLVPRSPANRPPPSRRVRPRTG